MLAINQSVHRAIAQPDSRPISMTSFETGGDPNQSSPGQFVGHRGDAGFSGFQRSAREGVVLHTIEIDKDESVPPGSPVVSGPIWARTWPAGFMYTRRSLPATPR
uniref:U1740n n=1 Tax=Mycobacterium leprae TaxID=1769 RepID=Q50073_MYCLR|nr:u1740n [Mycobacterium leprae]